MRNVEYDLEHHKKSDTVKWVAIFLAVILLGIAVMAAITMGFSDWNPYGWFGEEQESPAPPEEETAVVLPPVDDSGKEFPEEETHELPRKMVFRSSVATGAEAGVSVTLTATVKPENATNKILDWTAEFVNPTSEWASGKDINDYLQLIETGNATAQITCVAPFGEQVKITVTSQDNPEAKAECVVDYAKRITDLTVALHKGSVTGAVVTTASGSESLSIPFNDTTDLYMTLEPIYGVGTIEDTFTYAAKGTPAGGLDVVVTTVLEFAENDLFPTEKNYTNPTTISFPGGYQFLHQFVPMDYEDSSGIHYTVSTSSRNAFYNGVIILLDCDTVATFDFTATGEYSTYQKSVNIHFAEGTLKFAVESVSIDDTTLVF